MDRRRFISISGAGLLGAARLFPAAPKMKPRVAAGSHLTWRRHEASQLFDKVAWDGQTLIYPEGIGLFDGFCSLIGNGKTGKEFLFNVHNPKGQCGPVQLSLSHRLLPSRGSAEEDLLEATLKMQNMSGQPCETMAGFLSGVRPCLDPPEQQIYVPLTARGLRDNSSQYACHQYIGFDGYLTHYREPEASDPRGIETKGQLLVPVVDIFADHGLCHVALFSSPLEPAYFQALEGPSSSAWRTGRRITLKPGESRVVKAYLLLHPGDAAEAWTAFHRFAHQEDLPPVEWVHEFRANYFDFLSATEAAGRRGNGYEADCRHFREFHVGMATQHGYYLALGDYLHPDRKEWRAMPTDSQGPVQMSLEKMRARIQETRRHGAHPMVYLHYTLFDDGSPLYERMKDFIQLDAAGKPVPFGWEGPDVIKKTWKMSVAAPEWREHLVQQAQWVMELLGPDGIVLDETFTALGMDYHPARRGPLSPGGIELMRSLRSAVRSFGPDKALFASDCSMGNYCLWGDGEAGDHCYDRLLGNPLYRQKPVRYMAALGDKAWHPCAWLFKSLWPVQMDLARKVGAGVGLTNGYGDNIGLARLPAEIKKLIIRDIMSLSEQTAT
jgi:hypothetical protein